MLTLAGAGALICAAASAAPTAILRSAPSPVNVKRAMSVGDAAFKRRGKPEQALKALDLYRQAHRAAPGNFETGWRLAMICYFVGLRLTEDPDGKAALFAEGRNAGKASLKANPSCAACHFWTAINMALYGDTIGVFKMLFSLGAVREHLEASLKLDPKYAFSGAHRVLGKIEQKLPGLLGGSDKEARKHFEAAVATSPDEPLNYFFLAELLFDEFGENELALEVAGRGLTVKTPAPERVESTEALGDLRELIQRIEKD